ncbi:MAG: phosphopentomutase [Armatimonadota bacterium]
MVLVVLDSVGVGDAPDAAAYGDAGSNTLVNTARAVGGLEVPNLQALGLGNIAAIAGVSPDPEACGAWGRLTARAAGKDSITGHWELMGLVNERPFPTYPEGFPEEIIAQFARRTGRGVIGNRPASGTAIIEELIAEHLATGALIVYTSADSVFQVAAHEQVVPIEELYRCCEIARELLVGEHCVARVIARPFVGEPGALRRTERRRDFALPPPAPTALDLLSDAGVHTWGVGKIEDLFAGRGVQTALHTGDNAEGCRTLVRLLREGAEGLIFVNLNDFDSKYGHRNDPHGYARALTEFDGYLSVMREALGTGGVLAITADHGTDPTTPSTDHSRERVPLLVAGDGVGPVDLGTRESFADVAATICELFGAAAPPAGTSFAPAIIATGEAP